MVQTSGCLRLWTIGVQTPLFPVLNGGCDLAQTSTVTVGKNTLSCRKKAIYTQNCQPERGICRFRRWRLYAEYRPRVVLASVREFMLVKVYGSHRSLYESYIAEYVARWKYI